MSVDVSAHAGDRPMVFARPKKDILITMLADGRKRFTLSRKLSGEVEQPAWAFVLSNSSEELFLCKNAGKPALTLRSKKTPTEVDLKLSVAQARDLHASLTRAIDESGLDVQVKAGARVTPMGHAVTYECERLTFKPRSE